MRSPNIARIVEDLRQTECTRTRRIAITTLGRSLRRDHLFQPLWDAVGGAAGLAGLMAEFSLRDVRIICNLLGRTASAQKARLERHAGLAELVRILHEGGPQRDPRPLGKYYQDIVPACSLEVVREWDEQRQAEWSKFQRLCLLRSHREWYEKRFIQFLFPSEGEAQSMSFSVERKVFEGNPILSEAIFSSLIADKQGASRIPRDFMREFVMPLLNQLFRRRRSDSERRNNTCDKFLYLAVQCVQVHEEQLVRPGHESDQEQLLKYAIKRWSSARDKRAPGPVAVQNQTELCLVRMVELMPRRSRQLCTLRQMFEMVLRARRPHVDSYQLLRLILLHTRDYEIDIDDSSPSTLARLKDLTAKSNLWPMGLFMYLDVRDAIGLFEKLSDVDVTSSFLVPERSWHGSRTILEQDAMPSSRYGDAEIVRCLLYGKSAERADDESWRARARSLVHERRKMSEEGREWQQRAFWAKSAINLCVAAGDAELLDDTVLWVRRFNNQPLVVRNYYGATVFNSLEIRDLLSAVPDKVDNGEVSSPERVAAVKKAIQTSGRIIVHLMETISMTMSQPQAEMQNWNPVLSLPKLVVDHRVLRKNAVAFDALFGSDSEESDYPSSGVLDAVWKPTIDILVQAEALLSATPHLFLPATGIYVFRELLHRSGGKARAELASFLIESIKTHMGPEGLRRRMHDVVEMVTGVADSDQPWLAIPFIRDLVLHGDSADSVWHRQLLSARFLASLPSKSVSDLLYTMAEAIKEKMREQNSRPREVIGEDGKPVQIPPAVKVTTIKMMAQLLQGSEVVGPSAACDMLLGLLAEARHIDSLAAVVSSLLAILQEPTYSPEVHARVLGALEVKLAPVLSQLSERRPVSEEDWAAAESGDAGIPDVPYERPLTALLLAQDYGPESMSRETRERLIGLLMRAPEQSAAKNARWNDLFLRRNGFRLTDGIDLPACPASPDVLRQLLSKFPASMPARTFESMHKLALVNLRPTPGIARVTAAVKADRDLVNSNAGAHWLAQWDVSGRTALLRFGIFKAADLLQDPPDGLTVQHGDGDGITMGLLADTVLTVAERLIACELPEVLQELVGRLRCTRPDSHANRVAWRENCVPLLRRLTEKIDALRSGRAQLPDGEPVPRVLPSSFRPRLSALSMPYSSLQKEPAAEEDVDAFMADVDGLLEWLVARQLPYHEEFTKLKREVRSSLRDEECARAALRLGRLGGGSRMEVDGEEAWGLADYLRLELAGDLLSEVKIPADGDVVLKLKQIVREWVASDVELVRLKGLSLEKKHKDALSE